MSYKIVWNVGGFVFSELIYEIKQTKNIELLNPKNPFSFIQNESDGDKYYFISKTTANSLIINYYEDYQKNNKVIFKSRFLPSDYFSILYTFIGLEEYEYNLSAFISDIYLSNKNKEELIKRILFSLYLLTYYDISQPNSSDILNFNENFKKAQIRKKEIYKIIKDEKVFEKEFYKFTNNKIYNQKRAWCSLRDFLKSPEFKKYFQLSLKEFKLNDADFDILFSLKSLNQLELPGDVWNNNSKFRNCILKNSPYIKSKLSLNKILREYFEENKSIIDGYPEQFDITFNFVPKMCEENNCDFCPINRILQNNNFDKICINNKKMFCPVALICCNYKNLCVGEDKCKLKKI